MNPPPSRSPALEPLAATAARVFAVRGLSKTYGVGEAAVHALAGVDLDLFSGELIVLLGPSGSGKSTLLNLLGGLDVPTGGILRYRDWDLGGADEEELSDVVRSPEDCCDTVRLLVLEEVEGVSHIDESEGDDVTVGCLIRDRERKRGGR